MNVIWDMGGTLIDTYTPLNEVFYSLVHRAAVRDGDRAAQDFDPARVAALTHTSISFAMDEIARQTTVTRHELSDAYEKLKVSWKDQPAPLMPHARDVLAAVKRMGGLNLVVTHRDRESAQTLLREHRLDVDDMVCVSDGFARKPDPGMFLEVIRRHGLHSTEIMSVGDRLIDVQASHAAGVRAALIVPEGLDSGVHGLDSARLRDSGRQKSGGQDSAVGQELPQRDAPEWIVRGLGDLLDPGYPLGRAVA